MSVIKADNLTTVDGTKTIPTARVAQGTAAAWVNFNGTGVIAINASYNVSSITDAAVGEYAINFATAMPDANYVVGGLGRRAASNSDFSIALRGSADTNGVLYTASAFAVRCSANTVYGAVDSDLIGFAVFR